MVRAMARFLEARVLTLLRSAMDPDVIWQYISSQVVEGIKCFCTWFKENNSNFNHDFSSNFF